MSTKRNKAIMVVAPNNNGMSNIGDFIQAQAAKQFIGNADVYIERDRELNKYDGNDVDMIMNGWFMDYGENFPPSNKIHPLYVAFHINKLGLPGLLSQAAIEHYKKYQPIGCRDTHTAELLKEHGIDAYFSGCLTLTLGQTYRNEKKEDKAYVVDAYFSTHNLSKRPKLLMSSFLYLLCNYNGIKKITSKKGENGLKALLHNSIFLKEYSKAFDKKTLIDAEYICQFNHEIANEYLSYNKKMDYAEQLIKKYAKAKLVITSRIHCALPCTGLETPVVYIKNINEDKASNDRFGGLIDFFNVIKWQGDGLELPQEHKKISKVNTPPLKNNWKPYAERMIQTCKNFVTSTQ